MATTLRDEVDEWDAAAVGLDQVDQSTADQSAVDRSVADQ
jgi:hypothetical protein